MRQLARPEDASAWAASLGISREAVHLYQRCEVIDLHLDTFIWQRLFGYDLGRRHGKGLFGGRLFGSADFPRARDALTGSTWVITTQPWRSSAGRQRAFWRNLQRLTASLDAEPGFRRVATEVEYRRAREDGQHAAFVGVQGGNALDHDLGDIARLEPRDVLLVTLLHGTRSGLGTPSTLGGDGASHGLTARGKAMVEALDAARIFVDLAHIAPRGFWDAVDVQQRGRPLMVSHTGLSGVRPLWRNLDDAQLRAVADSGGVVGVILHGHYLGGSLWSGGTAERVVDHIEHVIRIAGEDVPALGSDFDGMIVPPRDLRSVLELPRLVEIMLRRGHGERVIGKVLGENLLAALGRLRG